MIDIMDTPFLTTYDNPYDPYEQFDQWLLFDSLHGYDCCGIVARLAYSSNKLFDSENDSALDAALDSFISNDILGLYVKVDTKTAKEIAFNASHGKYLTVFNAKENKNQ